VAQRAGSKTGTIGKLTGKPSILVYSIYILKMKLVGHLLMSIQNAQQHFLVGTSVAFIYQNKIYSFFVLCISLKFISSSL